MGGPNTDSAYSDSQLSAGACTGKTKGACALDRIRNGSMPAGRGCTGNPVTDSNNTACLTAVEQTALENWISAGQVK